MKTPSIHRPCGDHIHLASLRHSSRGFSVSELALVLFCGGIVMAMAVPSITSLLDRYRLVTVTQAIASQMHFARIKAVTSNEEIRVNFPSGQSTYQVETSAGNVLAGPFQLPNGVSWNTGCGSAITFSGNYITFLPTGGVPASGAGSLGRAKVVNRAGEQVDLVVQSGGIIRQTTPYSGCTPPF